MSNCGGCSKKIQEATKKCPLCHRESDYLHYLVVKSVVKEDLKKLVISEKYYTCKNSECEVVFFNGVEDVVYLLQDIDLSSDFNGVTKTKKPQCGGCSGKCQRPNI
ncbi:hypothetical protein [Alkaliphilus transvaalensis]|uniref:hypothetical protein n=1 Tax=Alkaliphilus transvaalensis TaxID=114628 RepID=UPI00047CFB24|nr:hypothetical protein [Alkaliphilus transvaalensis]